MSSEKVKTYFDNLTSDLKDIAELELELFKIKTAKKISFKGSEVVSTLVLILLITTIIFLSMVTLALYLGTILGEWFLGFGVITLVYLVAFTLLIVFKKTLLKRPICNAIIKSIFN